MEADHLLILKEISEKVEQLNTSLTKEVHALNLGMVELRAEVKGINENLGSRVDRLENEYRFLGNSVQINKDLIHEHDKCLVQISAKLLPLPDEVQKERQRIAVLEQKVIVIEESNNLVQTVEIFDRLDVMEKSVLLLNEHVDDIKENTKARNKTSAVWAFFNSKPGWAAVLFVCGLVAYKFGIGVTIK